LKAGAEIQRSLMAINPPDAKTIDVVWRFMPCQRIGGDIFNILRLDEDHWAIYMLDVSGHGITSSMVAVSVSQMLQPRVGFLLKKNIEKAPYYEIVPPTEVLNEMDREYPIERFDKFFTISYCILNVKDGTLRYSNAGHPPPVLLRKDGSLELLNEGGTIIGMGGLIPFEEGRRKLCSGDKLFLYTDGIAEYQNEDGLFYDEDRFFAELKRLKDRLLSNIIDGVIESMMSFGNNTEPQDDISLLAVEFRGQT
jgi:sigma-B regulation protein RsbU (phosphoserine phosphatase)